MPGASGACTGPTIRPDLDHFEQRARGESVKNRRPPTIATGRPNTHDGCCYPEFLVTACGCRRRSGAAPKPLGPG